MERKIKVTISSQETADAVVQKLLVVPEGIAREIVDNLVLPDSGCRVGETLSGDINVN